MVVKSLRKIPGAGAKTWQAPSVLGQQVLKDQEEVPEAPSEVEAELDPSPPEPAMPTAEQLDQWREDAEQEGYEEGLKRAQQEAGPLLQQLQQTLDFLQAPVLNLPHEVEQELAHLAVILAQQLLRRELQTDPGEIVGLVRDSLKLLPAAERDVRVHVHPEDAGLLRRAFALDQESGESEQNFLFKLVEDSSISRGGCDLRTPHSRIDASVENRLSRMAAAVLGGQRSSDKSAPVTADEAEPEDEDTGAQASVATDNETQGVADHA